MKCFPLMSRLGFCALLAISLFAAGCKSSTSPTNSDTADTAQDANDPANANVVPISDTTTSAPASTASSSSAGQSGSADQYSSNQYNDSNGYGEQPETYAPQPPPELPQYDQPPCPQQGDIWTPGYWHYDSGQGYYWVPGAWVQAPYVGALWTPGYWGWRNGRYAWYRGYWGRHVGYYGGINYGFGYVGFGYQGGYWRGNEFAYNTAVNRVNTSVIRNVYNYRIRNVSATRVSYNGGNGGLQYHARPAEVYAIREEHTPPMSVQVQIRNNAMSNRDAFYNVNRGRLNETTVVVNHHVEADRDVRPPAVVHYERGERPEERRAEPPIEAHPVQEPARGQERVQPEQNRHESHPAQPERRPEAHNAPDQHKPDAHGQPRKPDDRREPR